MAEAGWLGITMPEKYGGSGLGVTEAMVMMMMMNEVASTGGGFATASAIHINLFLMKRLQIVFGGPYSAGASRHHRPFLITEMMPLTIQRSSIRGTPCNGGK